MRNFTSLLKDLRHFCFILLAMICLAISFRAIFSPEIVIGHSMENSLHEGDYLISNRIAYKYDEPHYNDIVSFDSDIVAGHDLFIKRVIGLPGDVIQIKDNVLFRNSKAIHEPYIKEPMVTSNLNILLDKDQIFVMGDNRNNSMDSRDFGPIDYHKEVRGRVLLRLRPFNQDFK